MKGQVDCVKELILANADVNDYGKSDYGPLFLAATKDHVDCLKELIKAKADVDKVSGTPNWTPLHIAAFKGHVKCLNELINAKADINKCTIDGITPLYISAQDGKLDCLKKLISVGVDINKGISKDGRTPLFVAAQNGHMLCLNELIEAEADLNKVSFRGRTPLCQAAAQGNLVCVQNLIEAGADPSIKDDEGNTALMLADKFNRKYCLDFLKIVPMNNKRNHSNDIDVEVNNAGPAKPFQSLKGLEILYLEGCRLSNLENGIFKGLDYLSLLTLAYNLLSNRTNMYLNLKDLTQLTSLDLNHNRFSLIDNTSFPALSNLWNLDLSSNPVTNIGPESFSNLPNLSTLSLNNNSRLGKLLPVVKPELDHIKPVLDRAFDWYFSCVDNDCNNGGTCQKQNINPNTHLFYCSCLYGSRSGFVDRSTTDTTLCCSTIGTVNATNNKCNCKKSFTGQNCDMCDAGFASNNCNPCTLGNYCKGGNEPEIPCPAGFYCPTTATKIICSEKHFCPSRSTKEEACPSPGYYCPINSSIQLPCPAQNICYDGLLQGECSKKAFEVKEGILFRKTGPNYQYVEKCEKLDLSRFSIFEISENAFNGLTELVQLDLTLNNITSLHPNTFAGAPKLDFAAGNLLLDLQSKCTGFGFDITKEGVLLRKKDPAYEYVTTSCSLLNLTKLEATGFGFNLWEEINLEILDISFNFFHSLEDQLNVHNHIGIQSTSNRNVTGSLNLKELYMNDNKFDELDNFTMGVIDRKH
eukprot:Pgem_evm1s19469